MASHSTDRPRSRSTGSTGSTYDPLKKYRNTSLSQGRPLTDKNRAAINPEVVPVLEEIARCKGLGAQQLQTLNRTASVSSLASDQSAVSTWHISRDVGYRNKLTLSHKREVVSKEDFKGSLPASRENWYERLKVDPRSAPSGTKYDTDCSKIMFREGHYQQIEQEGDTPSYRKDRKRKLRQAVKGLTFFDFFEDNPNQSGNFNSLQTFTRYHPSKRSQREQANKNIAPGEYRTRSERPTGSASGSSLGDDGMGEAAQSFRNASAKLEELGGVEALGASIRDCFGSDSQGRLISDLPALKQQYLDYQAMIRATAPSDKACREALDYLMARHRYLSATAAKKRQPRKSGVKAAGPA